MLIDGKDDAHNSALFRGALSERARQELLGLKISSEKKGKMASNQEEFGSGGSCVIHDAGQGHGAALDTQQVELTISTASNDAVDGSLRGVRFSGLKKSQPSSAASSAVATAGSVRARLPTSSMKTRPGSRTYDRQSDGNSFAQSPRFIGTPSPSGSVSLLCCCCVRREMRVGGEGGGWGGGG